MADDVGQSIGSKRLRPARFSARGSDLEGGDDVLGNRGATSTIRSNRPEPGRRGAA